LDIWELEKQAMESQLRNLVCDLFFLLSAILVSGVKAWTSEIHGRVVCDVCGDSSVGPEDQFWKVSPSSLLPALLFGFVS
jgi:hypothetical protein